MARKLKINRTYRRILKYLVNGESSAFIIKNTKIGKGNYYKKLKMLEKHGYISKKRVGKVLDIHILPNAAKELTMVSGGAQRVDYLNIHNVWFSCKILKKPKDWSTDLAERILEVRGVSYNIHAPNNWKGIFFDHASINVRITPNKVLFNPPQMEIPLNDEPSRAKNLMLTQVKAIIPKIESWFSISLSKPNKVSMSVSSQHIAFVGNAIAKYFSEKGIDLKIYDNRGKLRLIVDKSRGPELEAVDKAHAEEDAEKIKDLLKDTLTGRFDHRKINEDMGQAAEVIRGLAENQKTFSDNMVTYGQKIAAHTSSIEALGEGVTKLVALIEELKKTIRRD